MGFNKRTYWFYEMIFLRPLWNRLFVLLWMGSLLFSLQRSNLPIPLSIHYLSFTLFPGGWITCCSGGFEEAGMSQLW
jgi:hypothetical protein